MPPDRSESINKTLFYCTSRVSSEAQRGICTAKAEAVCKRSPNLSMFLGNFRDVVQVELWFQSVDIQSRWQNALQIIRVRETHNAQI